jgi:DNA-binding IclR family transcriptional regulator
MSSLDRMLRLLDAFTPERPVCSNDALIRFVRGSRSTTYRYVRALQNAGLLSPVANGSWTLGPRILELDLQLRSSDPLYIAGAPVLRRLMERTGHTALLCTLFSDAVICIRDEPGPQAPPGLFSRGQRRPIFTAAASKILLPYLPPHQLRRIYANHTAAIAASGLGGDWKSFLAALRAMREDGYCFTRGEFRPGIVGFAVPILTKPGIALASLGIALRESKFRAGQRDRLIQLVKTEGAKLTAQIRRSSGSEDLLARGVGRIKA